MSAYSSRPYKGDSDLHSLIDFARELNGPYPSMPPYYHAGDIVWQLYEFDASDDVCIWRNAEDDVVACAVFEPPLNFQFAVDPRADERALAAEVTDWVRRRRARIANPEPDDVPLAYRGLGMDTLSTWVFEGDVERAAMLTNLGYERGGRTGVRHSRALDATLPDVALPPGARFRHITDSSEDIEARAELHRASWSVWGESKHTAERYRRVRAAPLYDAELDVVLELGGELVSYCICWLDTVTRTGLFEPVGTRPSATQRGFGRAVIREGLRRLRERGAETAFVATAEVNPAAKALYVSAGFDVVDHDIHFFTKGAAR